MVINYTTASPHNRLSSVLTYMYTEQNNEQYMWALRVEMEPYFSLVIF